MDLFPWKLFDLQSFPIDAMYFNGECAVGRSQIRVDLCRPQVFEVHQQFCLPSVYGIECHIS